MAQPFDFRVNEYIHDYLDSKGYANTANTFVRERRDRQELPDKSKNGSMDEKEKEKQRVRAIKVVIPLCQWSCNGSFR